jgi:SAM-dependent methyltransferase
MHQLEALASPGVHEKVLELVEGMSVHNVLDAPCGYGALTEKLLASGKSVTAGDIDLDKFMLSPETRNLKLVHLDLTSNGLPVEKNGFDLAICVEGIEHLENQWNLIRNLFSSLKPGGYLILTTPNILNFRSRMRYLIEGRYEFFKRPLVKGESIPHDLNTYHIAPVSYFELQFILESCGFSIRELHPNKYSSRHFVSRLVRPVIKLLYRYKNHRDMKRNRGEFRKLYETIMSDEIFYGETLILVAQRPNNS